MEFNLEEFKQKYDTLQCELRKQSKEDIINYTVTKQLIDEVQNVDYWWAVDNDGIGHLFDHKPFRGEGVWDCPSGFSGYTADLSPIIEKEYKMTWEDEPINITIKF